MLERKVVTILFADIVGSTELASDLDAERLRDVMTRYRDTVAARVREHGGTMEKFIGDAVMAVFGSPLAHEDDPQRAIGAAFAIRDAVGALHDGGLAVRIGVQTGEVLADPAASARGEFMVTGEAVHYAQRLQAAAGPSEILVDARTWAATRERASFEPVPGLALKGFAAPITAYRAVGPLASPAEPPPPVAFVGREYELAVLRLLFEKVCAERRPHLVTIVGPPGIGKTRLAERFREWIASTRPDTTVRGGACKPYGEAHLYCPVAGVVAAELSPQLDDTPDAQPFVELLTDDVRRIFAAAGKPEPAAERLARVIASCVRGDCPTDPPPTRDELFRAWRFPIEAHAVEQPVVVTFDNLQWSSDEPLDFIECLGAKCSDQPVMVVALARPEFLEHRPGWGREGGSSTTIALGPLAPVELRALVGDALGGEVDAPLAAAVEERAGGNPQFAIEFARSLSDAGAAIERDGRWVLGVAAEELPTPPSLQALIASRIDSLPAREKRALLLAAYAAYSRFFYDRPMRRAGDLADTELDAALDGLLMKGLIREIRPPSAPGIFGYVAGSRMFAFPQVLLREVAHDMVPRAQRPRLYLAFADWLEELMQIRPDTALVLQQIAATNLYEAWRIQHERGEVDASLAERAYRYCVGAGEIDAACRAPREAADDMRRALEIARSSLPHHVTALSERLEQITATPIEVV